MSLSFCPHVRLSVHALAEKRPELSTPKLVQMWQMADHRYALILSQKVEGQGTGLSRSNCGCM